MVARIGPAAGAGMLALALLLSGCSGTPKPVPSLSASASSSATPSASASSTPAASASPSVTPSPSPSPLTATVPSTWKPAAASVTDALKKDPSVTAVIGAWTTAAGTGDVSIVAEANSTGATDAEAYFASRFGSLGPNDGVTVSHSVTTNASGAPVLFVDVEPAAGVGGDAQSSFFIFYKTTIVSGLLTYKGAKDPTTQTEFHNVALSIVGP